MRHKYGQWPNIREETHLNARKSIFQTLTSHTPQSTHLVDVIYHTIHDLSLEWLEHNRAVTRYELGLPTPTQHDALSYIQDGNNCDDVPKLP